MTEFFDVADDVIRIGLHAIVQIEERVDRYQSFCAVPAVFRDLESDCEAVHDSLRSLDTNVQYLRNLRQKVTMAPEDTQRFKSDARNVEEIFERAQEKCENVEKYFPPAQPDSPSCHGCLLRPRRALLRFSRAKIIARECKDISRMVKDANVACIDLIYFVYTSIYIEDVENGVEQVGVAVNTLLQTAEAGASDANDDFKANYFVPALSRTIILDFSTCDAEDVPITMEGKLKRALIDIDSHSEFSRVAEAVGAVGMGGVGKTNALKGLGWNSEVRDRFKKGGIYFLSFGKDAGVGDVIEQLALAVEVSGGGRRAREIRGSKTLRGAIEIVVDWFLKRETLFLCDDMWETAHSSVGYLNELKQLLTSRGRSYMVLSTRQQNIADAAGIPIKFGPRDSEGDLSRAILLKYANISEEDLTGSSEECHEATGNILRTCGGIPLTLGVAGRAVQTKARYCDDGLETAIMIYAEELETSTRKIMTEDIEKYPNFCATVRTSLDMVEEWAQKKGMCREGGEALVCSDLFTRMNVFPRQSRIPERAVKKLWGDVDDYDADRIVDKLVDLNLLSKREDKKNGVSVGLHDLVLEYCMIQARRDPRSFHCDFLDRYLTASEVLTAKSETVDDSALDKRLTTLEPRAWWSLSDDGYFPENVCRHLWKGGCVGELIALLCDVRWTAFRMRCGGLLGWKSDFESLTSAVLDVKKENGSEDWWKMVEGGLGLVREAVNEAWGYLKGNKWELGMQVHSRLFNVEAKVWPVSRYLRSVHAHCEKPWLIPLGGYWARPGTGASVELLVDVKANSIAMPNDGSVVAVGVGKEVLVMDVESRSILWRLVGHEENVTSVCISGDGAMVVSGSHDGTLRRWDGRNGEPLGDPLIGHDGWVRCVAMSRDGAMIVSGSSDGTLRRWDGRSGAHLGNPLIEHDGWVSCVAMSADGAMIVSGSFDKTLRRWDGWSGAPLGDPLIGHDHLITHVAMSGDGAMIVSRSFDKTLRRWDGRSGAPLGDSLIGQERGVRCVAVSGDGAMIVSGSYDGTLRRWDARSGAPLRKPLRVHDDWVNCVAMSGDGAMIVSGLRDGTLRLLDVSSQLPLGWWLRGHTRRVSCVAMSGDGGIIVSGSFDKTLRRWDGRSGAAVGVPLCGHDGWVSCVAMSGDGRKIVSGSHDGTLRRWDGGTGASLGEPLRGHKEWVSCVAMSGDGAMIVSGSHDGTLIRWDGRSGVAVGKPLCAQERGVTCVAMSWDGAMIVSYSFKTVQLWHAGTEKPVGTEVSSPLLTSIEIENGFLLGRERDGKLIRWRIDETCGLVDEEKWEPSMGWSGDTNRSGGSDASSSWVLRASSHELLWDGATGVHVLGTLPVEIVDVFFKAVSFRAGGNGDDHGESSYTVGAVVALKLANDMFCIFHLLTE